MSSTKSRDSALNAIKRYMRTSKGASANAVDQEVIATYLQLLEEQWSRFCDAQEKVELSCGDEAIAVEEQSRMQAEEWYTTAKANFKRAIKERNVVPTGDTPTAYAAVQLPKMELPIFSGDHTDWLNFHDSFNQLVHSNASLSNGQKLHYLRGCLKGEALELINGLSVCDVNYGAAWDLLTKRFKSMRVIVDSHIKALFAIPKASKDCAKDIKCVLNPTSQHTGALRSLGRPVGSWDNWLVHLTVSKLAYETRKQWELSLVNDVLPSFASLSDFLEIRARSLEMLSASTTNIKNAKSVLTCEQQAVTYHPPPKNTALLHCTFCNCNHKIYSCKKFVQLNAVAKLAAIRERNACINCLCKGHTAEKCNSNSLCRICQQRHHTSLHGSFNHYSPCSTSDAAEDEPAQTSSHTASHPPDADRVILLATAQVQLQDCAGRWQPARALFDNGSHASFITEACVQRLRLRRTASSAFITGIGSTHSGQAKGEVKVVVSPRSQEQRIPINVLILSKITNDLPPFQLPTSSWPHLLDLPLADTHFTVPGPIDVLIGMDEMDKFLLDGLRKGPNGTPMAQRTAFGWVVFGNTTNSANASTNIKSLHCDTRLTKLVAKFFELEEPQERKHYSAEENFCEKLFKETTQRAADGRFIVRLPLKEEIKLGESRNAAVRGLLRMERKFESDERLYEAYCNFMQELIILGHMEPANDSTSKTYYMPHRAVLKSTSATTKLRVVFNASMKTSSGFSLNDALMIGPQLQQDLFSILVRFRTHRLALIADVEKMYRQVYVAKQDVDFQRIVWRRNSTEPIRDYRLLRVTYGVAAASHLAVKSLQQAAIEAGEAYRKTANVIINDFYMDDLLTGSETSECLSALQQDISHVLSQRGFELRKWATNCDQLRRKIPNVSKNVSHLLAEGDEVRTLGIIWHTNDDWLSIAVDLEELPVRITKRLFLSDSSKIFDPLGLIAPCTIRSKILLQKLWRANVDWDEAIPPEVMSEWLVHRNELPMLSSLKLARWLGTNTTAETEYHVFTDASEAAYAAVVYCRTQHPNGVINVELVAARTKVAPLKSTTFPDWSCAAPISAPG